MPYQVSYRVFNEICKVHRGSLQGITVLYMNVFAFCKKGIL